MRRLKIMRYGSHKTLTYKSRYILSARLQNISSTSLTTKGLFSKNSKKHVVLLRYSTHSKSAKFWHADKWNDCFEFVTPIRACLRHSHSAFWKSAEISQLYTMARTSKHWHPYGQLSLSGCQFNLFKYGNVTTFVTMRLSEYLVSAHSDRRLHAL